MRAMLMAMLMAMTATSAQAKETETVFFTVSQDLIDARYHIGELILTRISWECGGVPSGRTAKIEEVIKCTGGARVTVEYLNVPDESDRSQDYGAMESTFVSKGDMKGCAAEQKVAMWELSECGEICARFEQVGCYPE